MIIVFTGLPRNLDKNLGAIKRLVKKLNALLIFSTSKNIRDFKLPSDYIVIINENDKWYEEKFKKITKYPKHEYINMLQWIRFSCALRYIENKKLASSDTVILKLRTDISNLEVLKIENEMQDNEFYMNSDLAFAGSFTAMNKIDKLFFSNPENFMDFNLITDVQSKYFLNSEKKAARFEWLVYPRMISTFLPGKIFKFLIKTKFEKFLWFGPKNYNKQKCFRYYKDIRRFQSEPAFLWSILKENLYVKNLSKEPIKLDKDRR